MEEQDFQTTLQAQATHEQELLSMQNVVGVAVGMKANNSDEVALVVLVTEKMPLTALSAEDRIPGRMNGVRTDVVEVGELRAQQTPRDRWRPRIPAGGVSLGHYQITAGTLGVMVRDRTTGERLILSNNHVMANSNDAQLGDVILQPGTLDGGMNPGDVVATLARFIPLRYVGEPEPVNPTPPSPPSPTPTPPPAGGTQPQPNGCLTALVSFTNLIASITGSQQKVTFNASASSAKPEMPVPKFSTSFAPVRAQANTVDNTMDVALARPLNPNMFSDSILNIGVIDGTKAAQIGMMVRKSGRTTGLTQGRITLLNATVNVGFGNKTARFTGQVIAEPMSQGGDSGSLVVDFDENKAVGLLFAGSPLATIFTPIDTILGALNVTF